MIWLIVGTIISLVTLLLLIVVVMEVVVVRSERKIPQLFQTKKHFPFGMALLTIILLLVSAFLLPRGLNETVWNPYRRAGDDQISITNEDKHLSIEVWLKKDQTDLKDNMRIVIKAATRGSLAIGLGDVEVKSDILGLNKSFPGEGKRWGSGLGGFMGMSGYERDEEEFFFSANELYLTQISIKMKVEYVLAEGSGPSMFQNFTQRAQIDVVISEFT